MAAGVLVKVRVIYRLQTIARDLKLSRSTVKRALRDLEQTGYLEKQKRYRKNGSCTSNLYTLSS